MAKDFKLSNGAKSQAADAIVDLFDDTAGYLNIYDGTKPANPNTAITTQTLLATVVIDAAFSGASSGVATTAALGSAVVLTTGTASWFRIFTSGDVVVADGTVGATNDFDLTLSTTSLVEDDEISGVTLTYTQA